MQFGKRRHAVGKANPRIALAFAPPARSVQFTQSAELTYTPGFGNGLDGDERPDDLEVHMAIVANVEAGGIRSSGRVRGADLPGKWPT